MHIELEQQVQKAIVNGQFNGNGQFNEEEFEKYVKELVRDLDDETQMNILLMEEVRSGDLTLYLLENGFYGSNNQSNDWEHILAQYFMLQGIIDNYNDAEQLFETMDEYTAGAIYNAVYDVEEYGCEQAMISQFGAWGASRQGFINQGGYMVDSFLDSINMNRNNLPSYMLDAEGNITAGAAVGISFGVIAAVAFISFGTYKVGRRYSSKDKKAPLISDSYQPHTENAEKLKRFRTSIV